MNHFLETGTLSLPSSWAAFAPKRLPNPTDPRARRRLPCRRHSPPRPLLRLRLGGFHRNSLQPENTTFGEAGSVEPTLPAAPDFRF